MTEERARAERETMEIIRAIHEENGQEALLRVAAMSYARGVRDGAEIAKQPDPDKGAAA